MTSADSAGTPWAGRHFEDNSFAADDGTAPAGLIEAIRRFRLGELGEAEVITAVRASRLLVPLVARLGETGLNEHGRTVDTRAELAIVTVVGPDGRGVLPVFNSVDALRRWNPMARPVPADAVRIALAAASEQTDLVVLDPTSATEFAIRRPALWAIAQSRSWLPSYLDPEVGRAFGEAAATDDRIVSAALAAGDPDARLAGPELVVSLALVAGLDRAAVDAVVARQRERWTSDEVIATRVDSMSVRLVATG